MIKIHNDLLLAMDDKCCTLLILLDMSAAFHTVEHRILLNRLKHNFGITGSVNEWLQSLSSNRLQRACIHGVLSDPGMPQGSI